MSAAVNLSFWMKRARQAPRVGFAAVRHLLQGSPTVSQEIHYQRQEICVRCDDYDPEIRCCTICTCPIKDLKGWLNKLSWAEESCPNGFWGPVDPIQLEDLQYDEAQNLGPCGRC